MRYINIESDIDRISLHSSDIVEYLKINKPTSLKWFEGGGTVLEYFINIPNEYKFDDNYINSLDKNYTNNEDQLVDDIFPLLNILENGKYSICFHSDSESTFFESCRDRQNKTYWSLSLCSSPISITEEKAIRENNKTTSPNIIDLLYKTTDMIYEPMLLGTQPQSKINRDRVNYYKGRIEKGYRPFAIVLNSSSNMFSSSKFPSYIIDGHHKLLAYKELDIFPYLVEITKQGRPNPFIDSEYLLENLYTWQIKHIIDTCDNRVALFKDSLNNPQSKIFEYLE